MLSKPFLLAIRKVFHHCLTSFAVPRYPATWPNKHCDPNRLHHTMCLFASFHWSRLVMGIFFSRGCILASPHPFFHGLHSVEGPCSRWNLTIHIIFGNIMLHSFFKNLFLFGWYFLMQFFFPIFFTFFPHRELFLLWTGLPNPGKRNINYPCICFVIFTTISKVSNCFWFWYCGVIHILCIFISMCSKCFYKLYFGHWYYWIYFAFFLHCERPNSDFWCISTVGAPYLPAHLSTFQPPTCLPTYSMHIKCWWTLFACSFTDVLSDATNLFFGNLNIVDKALLWEAFAPYGKTLCVGGCVLCGFFHSVMHRSYFRLLQEWGLSLAKNWTEKFVSH